MNKITMAVAGGLSLFATALSTSVMAKPIYPNSVVSNDLEFIATPDARPLPVSDLKTGARPRCRTGARMV